MDVLIGFQRVAIEFQAGPFVIGLELIGFGYSERGTLYPPELLDPTKAPIVWTPDFVTNDGVNTGTLRRIDAAGNLYMRGKASLTNGIAKVAQLGIEADAWLMIRYRAPVEVVFSLEVGPTITLFDKITLDLKGLGSTKLDLWVKGQQFWLTIAQTYSLKHLITSLPAICDDLSNLIHIDILLETRLSIYAGPEGGGVRLMFSGSVALEGRVAEWLGFSRLSASFGVMLTVKAACAGAGFRVILQYNDKLYALPFCDDDSDCGATQACQLFICGARLPRGGPCTRSSQCQAGLKCGNDQGLLFCVQCTSNADCPSGTICDKTTFWQPNLLNTCRRFSSCTKRTYGLAVRKCNPGYSNVATVCQQDCYAPTSKDCGTYCTTPGAACVFDTGAFAYCAKRNYVWFDQLCSSAFKVVPAPETIGTDPRICGANYEPVDAGLKKAWNPATGTFTVTKLVRCRETACPRTHPKRCGDYCAQAEVDCPEVIWPLDATPRPCDFYDRVTQIIAPRSTALNKGTWGGWALVPPGRNYLPYGFSLKWEGRQGPSDDTALNAVRLLWEDNNGNGRVLKSLYNDGIFGGWTGWAGCPRGSFRTGGGALVAAQLKVEAPGHADDTAVNSMYMGCTNSGPLVITVGHWGSVLEWAKCAGGSAICGFRQQVKDDQGALADDWSLTAVEFACCRY